ASAMRQLVAAGFDAAPVQAFWEGFDADYFLRHQPEEIAWHAETILPIGSAPDTAIVAMKCFNDIGGTEVFIYTRDRDDLFATTTLLLDRVGLTIQDARILTLEDGYTLDSYVVLDAESSGPITAEREQQRIARQLSDALGGGPLPDRRRDGIVERKKRHFKVPVNVEFSDAPEGGRTMMTVTAGDQPGLLSAIGQAMQQAEVRLQNARIATFGERVEDVFYITDRRDQPVTDAAQRGALSEAIVEALSQ
ncbi:MAG: [protein-PII] uridylyltransferase, partial [Gammaproteobacteria bacterium]|nr:[protein-PII] uridylyltransferase [Gammaproteobacteria bacterium]